MALSMDPEVGAALARMVAGLGEPKPRPAVGDWRTLRENGNAMFGVIFRNESVEYAQRLQAHVPTELHVHPGVPHRFELFAPDADVSRRATADRVRALRSF